MKNLLIIILVLYAQIFFAQKQNNNWINGGRLWNFNNTATGDFTDSPINTDGKFKQSVSIASDRNTGNLLFYTNSINIYDKNNNIMDNNNGANLFGEDHTDYGLFNLNASMYGGNNAAQGSLIIPDPGNPNRYYVFSLVGNTFYDCNSCTYYDSSLQNYKYGLHYAIVDMTDGLGKIISKNNILFINTNTDVMTSCPSNDGGYWLVTQNDAGNFLSYKITTSGISAPIASSQTYNIVENGLKISPNKQYLYDMKGNNLYHFNSNNGNITFFKSIPNFDSSRYNPCTADFSEDSNIIYYLSTESHLSNPNQNQTYTSTTVLCKYNIATGEAIKSSDYSIGGTPFRNLQGALQRHPNGNIYIKQYEKMKTSQNFSNYEERSGWYKITNTNSAALNFNNVQYVANNNLNQGYTFPQLIEYPPVCINTIAITQNVTTNGDYKASNLITANSTINPNLIVNYAAGTQIRLLPGFQVSGNSTGIFRAYLQECNPYGLVPEPADRNSSKSPELLENSNLKIYPNPTSDILTIDSSKEKLVSWQLYDFSGKLMKNGNSNTVNVQSIPNASYVLKINLEKTQISKTIIVKH